MNQKRIIFNYLVAIFLVILLFPACTKTHEYTLVNTTDDTKAQAIIASDEFELNFELDQAVNEALAASFISSKTSGDTITPSSGNILSTIAGAVIDTSGINTGLIKISYYGKTADLKKGRLGDITIKHAVASGKVIPWNTKGASAIITFKNYEVFFLNIVNKALSLNGTCVITNVSGGLLKNIASPLLVPGDSLTDKMRVQLTFTYNDNVTSITTWAWNCNQLRFFNDKDSILTCFTKGDTTINSINAASWGSTRANQIFYTSITTPLLQNISAGVLSNPLSGRKVILGIKEPITVTYGVDQQGSPVNTGKPYGYILTWTRGGLPKDTVAKYY